MPKILKTVFLLLIAVNILLFGAHFFLNYYSRANKSQEMSTTESSSVNSSRELSDLQNGALNSRFEIKPYRVIQAEFIAVENNTLRFKNLGNQQLPEDTLKLEDKIFYVCRPPEDALKITVSPGDVTYFSYIQPSNLNRELALSERLVIVTLEAEDGREELNYIVSSKCEYRL